MPYNYDIVDGIFKRADAQDPFKYQFIDKFTHQFGKHKGKLMKDVPVEYLISLYKHGFYSEDNDEKFKYNKAFRNYVYYRHVMKELDEDEKKANKTK